MTRIVKAGPTVADYEKAKAQLDAEREDALKGKEMYEGYLKSV